MNQKKYTIGARGTIARPRVRSRVGVRVWQLVKDPRAIDQLSG